ncbi:MAG: GFA family protein [Spongiibacter sp.]|nr:GFA family protein [Spongiibacter sp.]
MHYPVTASCQCGQVSYELRQPPQAVIACHCTECQKLATGPFSVTAVVAASDISFSGTMKEWSRAADSGNLNHALFCPECGNRIYHVNPAAPDTLKLKLKPVNAEDNSLWEPTVHIWVSEKQPWYPLPEGVPTVAQQP